MMTLRKKTIGGRSDLRKCTKVFGYVSECSKRGRLAWLHRSSNWSVGSVLTPRMGNRLKNT